MFGKRTKLKLRRLFRRQKKQALDLGSATEDSVERHIFKRLLRLYKVRRFVVSWIGLIVVISIAVVLQTQTLSSYYTHSVPVSGGIFREGMIGEFTNANPLYAQTDVDASVSKLVFSGLFTVDTKGNLVPDIAENFNLDKSETIYTVKLKENVKWHDGESLNSEDVVFTYKTIQNPDSRSFLNPSFKGVEVTAVDDYTVSFKLSNSLSGFTFSLTTGIIPEHILSTTVPDELRSSDFNNISPIGTGPFMFDAVEVDPDPESSDTRVSLSKNENFHLNPANLERFIIRTYKDDEQLYKAFQNTEVDSMTGLKSLPEDADTSKFQAYNIPLAGEVMVFFKNTGPILGDKGIRKALVLGIDKKSVFSNLPYPVLNVDGPLLRSHTGYNQKYSQLTNNKNEAVKILDKTGWKLNQKTGIREKDNKPLQFSLHSSTSEEFNIVANSLKDQWRELGVDMQIVVSGEEDLQATVSNHNYDALLFGLLVGLDPDVYPFWHSSQAGVRSGTRLNLSEYKSEEADKALEAGRTRSDPENKAIKYEPFLKAWQADYPALALYQPQSLYVASLKLSGFDYSVAQSSVDRYLTVTDWKVRNQNQKVE